jgi:preprotein translocase subunit SecB
MIPPINFESLFNNAVKQSAEAAKAKTEANTH